MRTQNSFVLKNSSGEILRVIQWDSGKLSVVKNNSTGRIEFIQDTSVLANEGVEYTVLHEVSKSSITASGLDLGKYGVLAPMTGNETLKKTSKASDEDEDQYPMMLKWTAGSYAALIALVLIASLIKAKLIEDNEPVVVQVVKQERTFKSQTVRASKKKINKRRRVSKRKVRAFRELVLKLIPPRVTSTCSKLWRSASFSRSSSTPLGQLAKNFFIAQ